MQFPRDDREHPSAEAFRAFIRNPPFPCVGAKSALSRGKMTIVVARDITSGWDDMRIYPALLAFVARYRLNPDLFQSFAVVFEGPGDLSEEGFERNLWARAQSLTDKDAWLGQPHDARVADDPDNPHFSLSFGGEAFFVVGLHPNASRPARRFASPVLVFNLHAQFERLRAEGRYEKLRASILERDQALAGSVNPMLARHGEASEARQYSGRVVGPDWRCPLQGRPEQKPDARKPDPAWHPPALPLDRSLPGTGA
ncbi:MULTISPECIES: guanitoxin biosynthesis heme-dependent pre-guanitoxin N-hydroxylase GntA [unclassified Methylobacterium]|jgi:FPC/CPF motif-containing protein YcgG|uniref:guanitoxin biosynthesis heme-dependent pre-guanitoxin N-hydroxylase GntA n=1 Tax=unclassified Methylobacterium TaxID=2615210 RepID=UPI001352E099|nr:guanitoxin biosynthesis heme-dependent pre-guanitoxin N-hydroxylase GntA [Methylobacterium sp. 2A]MWV21124.1 YqcI/YcgG family protein [Methylobacterium sp. 2A]